MVEDAGVWDVVGEAGGGRGEGFEGEGWRLANDGDG